MTSGFEFLRHGDAGEEMASCSSTGDDDFQWIGHVVGGR